MQRASFASRAALVATAARNSLTNKPAVDTVSRFMTAPQPKNPSAGAKEIPDAQRITWVRSMLGKMRLQKALLPLFNHVLELQLSNQTGKGGVDKTSLTMVERYGAAADGRGWVEAQKKYDDCPKKKDAERKVWQT